MKEQDCGLQHILCSEAGDNCLRSQTVWHHRCQLASANDSTEMAQVLQEVNMNSFKMTSCILI